MYIDENDVFYDPVQEQEEYDNEKRKFIEVVFKFIL